MLTVEEVWGNNDAAWNINAGTDQRYMSEPLRNAQVTNQKTGNGFDSQWKHTAREHSTRDFESSSEMSMRHNGYSAPQSGSIDGKNEEAFTDSSAQMRMDEENYDAPPRYSMVAPVVPDRDGTEIREIKNPHQQDHQYSMENETERPPVHPKQPLSYAAALKQNLSGQNVVEYRESEQSTHRRETSFKLSTPSLIEQQRDNALKNKDLDPRDQAAILAALGDNSDTQEHRVDDQIRHIDQPEIRHAQNLFPHGALNSKGTNTVRPTGHIPDRPPVHPDRRNPQNGHAVHPNQHFAHNHSPPGNPCRQCSGHSTNISSVTNNNSNISVHIHLHPHQNRPDVRPPNQNQHVQRPPQHMQVHSNGPQPHYAHPTHPFPNMHSTSPPAYLNMQPGKRRRFNDYRTYTYMFQNKIM